MRDITSLRHSSFTIQNLPINLFYCANNPVMLVDPDGKVTLNANRDLYGFPIGRNQFSICITVNPNDLKGFDLGNNLTINPNYFNGE